MEAGLFDKILGGGSAATVSKSEAFARAMLAAIAADVHISDEEATGFNAVTSRMRIFQTQSSAKHRAMIEKIFGLLKRNAASHLLNKSAEGLPCELRGAAFAVVADLIFADGSVEAEEEDLLETMQKKLEVPDELALQVVRVMEIKNRN